MEVIAGAARSPSQGANLGNGGLVSLCQDGEFHSMFFPLMCSLFSVPYRCPLVTHHVFSPQERVPEFFLLLFLLIGQLDASAIN